MNNKRQVIILLLFAIICGAFSFQKREDKNEYKHFYFEKLDSLEQSLKNLKNSIEQSDLRSPASEESIRREISLCRLQLKSIDFWLRYLEPISYKKLNGPLPVEWETEVFEKFEKPYKRTGAGLSLAFQYLEEKDLKKDSLKLLILYAADVLKIYRADSVTKTLSSPDHFFLCNRLYLLNLAAIYTTGFECPDNALVIPELKSMMKETVRIYLLYNHCQPQNSLTSNFLDLYQKALQFVNDQPDNYKLFDHFRFISTYVNPLFAINQELIRDYHSVSTSYNDYSLNDASPSIFNKSLYKGQNAKGAYYMIEDEKVLNEIRQTGKLLFYDPILSKNNLRSCASCHKPTEYFTDTTVTTSPAFNKITNLARNTPSLLNVSFNHLLMLDGRHTSLQSQAREVTSNPIEMGSNEKEIMEKILSCKEYKTAFKKFLPYIKTEKEITFDQVASAITLYYNDFGNYSSEFDEIINQKSEPNPRVKAGFNLFMSKAQCATCHFVPQFNGVKPPYISSEFEVLGVPEDTTFRMLSKDSGRYIVNPAPEMLHAFRTGSLRNITHTKPYGHNGIFNTLDEIIDFYNAGGGSGKGLGVKNQTLSSDSLHLSSEEKKSLVFFLESLNENIIFDSSPAKLPVSSNKELNSRVSGGVY